MVETRSNGCGPPLMSWPGPTLPEYRDKSLSAEWVKAMKPGPGVDEMKRSTSPDSGGSVGGRESPEAPRIKEWEKVSPQGETRGRGWKRGEKKRKDETREGLRGKCGKGKEEEEVEVEVDEGRCRRRRDRIAFAYEGHSNSILLYSIVLYYTIL